MLRFPGQQSLLLRWSFLYPSDKFQVYVFVINLLPALPSVNNLIVLFGFSIFVTSLSHQLYLLIRKQQSIKKLKIDLLM